MRVRTVVLMILLAAALISVGIGVRRDDLVVADPAPEAEPTLLAPVDSLVLMEVLNGTREAGLARDVGLALASVAATAERFANAPHDSFPATLLINRRLSPERARTLAADLGGLPLLQEYDVRSDVDAVLVLGADFANLMEILDIRRAEY